MKKILLIALAIAAVSCNETPKDYATLSGKITNKNSDSLLVRSRSYSKTIKVNEDGSFSDTLKVEAGIYNLFDGKESTSIFLKNDADINLTIDTEEFDESIVYSGKGSETSSYLAKKALISESTFTPDLFDLDEETFKNKIALAQKGFSELFEGSKGLDSTFSVKEKESIDKMQKEIIAFYMQQKEMANQLESLKGNPSPTFVNYENYKGGTTSLSDLKGKYVYVDVWATWCGPCKREIPFLKEVEGKYHGKNIEFVSISIDQERDHDKWKKMINDKELGGTQLFADNAWKSDFVQNYKIDGIPRFILIDPKGNVVDADAPRPSSPKLVDLFNELKI